MFPTEDCNVHIQGPISRWDEGVPLGNGHLGCLIWGEANALRFSVDRDDLWDLRSAPQTSLPAFKQDALVELVQQGDVDKIREVFDAPYAHPTPTKLPAGAILLEGGDAAQYAAKLTLRSAFAEIKIASDTITTFLDATSPVGAVWLPSAFSGMSIRLQAPPYHVAGVDGADAVVDSVYPRALSSLGYPAPISVSEDEIQGFVQPVAGGYYAFLYGIRESNSSRLVAYTVTKIHPEKDCWKDAAVLLRETLRQGYNALLYHHSNWWFSYWRKSSVQLPDRQYEQNWVLAEYFLASSSRKGSLPAPLQGVWTADDGHLPPWKGDYHNDLNTQLTYSHYLGSGHWDEGLCFLEYLWDLRPAARQFASEFFGLPGECFPGVMALDGAPLGGWPMYSLAPTNHIWLCQLFYKHWVVTGDEAFLHDRAQPIMETAAIFFEALLVERDGKLYLPLSSSPELHDDTLKAWVTPNSTYDLALLHFLFEKAAELDMLCHAGKANRWAVIRKRLPDLPLTDDGVLMISPDEVLSETHRHFSHVLPIWPLGLLNPLSADDRRVIDATIDQLIHFGTGQWVGFSFAWMAMLMTLQGNGNGASHHLSTLFKAFYSKNGFHLNGDYKNHGICDFHYRPFTLETNMFAAAAMQSMLLQSWEGHILLFPAIPDEWKNEAISFTNLWTDEGVSVSAEYNSGVVQSVEVVANRNTEVTLVNLQSESDGKPLRLVLCKGVTQELHNLRIITVEEMSE